MTPRNAVLAALVFLGVLFAGCTSEGDGDAGAPEEPYDPATPTSEITSDGAMFRGDLARTGTFDTEAPRTLQGVKWQYTTGLAILSSPVYHEGIVYVGSTDGRFHAVNATTGQSVWTYRTDGPVTSSPAIADGHVYFGTRQGKVYQLTLDGDRRAFFDTGKEIVSSPLVHQGIVYIGGATGSIYALDVDTMRPVWGHVTGAPIISSPAYHDGKIFIGSNDQNLYAFDAATGDRLWNTTTDGRVTTTPAIADGKVYYAATDGFLEADWADNGTQAWLYFTAQGDEIWSSPTVHDDRIYFGTILGAQFYAVDGAARDDIWKAKAGGGVLSSSSYADGVVIFGSADHYVYALDATDGSLLWSYETRDEVSSSPWIQDGVVYVGSNDGTLYAFH